MIVDAMMRCLISGASGECIYKYIYNLRCLIGESLFDVYCIDVSVWCFIGVGFLVVVYLYVCRSGV